MGGQSGSKFEPVSFGGSGSKRKTKQTQESPSRLTKPVLPDRENTLALGAELIPLRRGGTTTNIPADEAMMDALMQRALRGKFGDVVDLYKRLDLEENEAISAPVQTFSPYMRRKAKESILYFLKSLSLYAAKLLSEGLVEIVDGRYVVSSEARTILQKRNAVKA